MFKQRHNKEIDSRVRFQIQDLIESYEKEWRSEIFFVRRNEVDGDGFQKKYVPKGSKLAMENQKYRESAGRKNSGVGQESSKEAKKGASAAAAKESEGAKKKSMF